MFGDTKEKNQHYYGSDTHRQIDKMIRSAKNMYVISPYIDSYYAKILARRSPATEFYIISSSIDRDAKIMLQGRGSRATIIIWALISLVVFYVELISGIGGYWLLLAILPFLWGLGKYFYRSRSARAIHLKIPRQFVHAKMYISDEQAISGSMNLTYKGTHSNVEHIEITKDKEEIEKLKEQFWDLWNMY